MDRTWHGNACPRTPWGCNLTRQHAAGLGAGGCRRPCAKNSAMRETLLALCFPENTGSNWPWWHAGAAGIARRRVSSWALRFVLEDLDRVSPGPPKRPGCGGDWLWFPSPSGLAIDRDTRGAAFRRYFPPRPLRQTLYPHKNAASICGIYAYALAAWQRPNPGAAATEVRSAALRNGWLSASRKVAPASLGGGPLAPRWGIQTRNDQGPSVAENGRRQHCDGKTLRILRSPDPLAPKKKKKKSMGREPGK
ncbi:hypothetical protein TcCL_Unassigned01086 [Trypanosoma cruzi]|nr:hypothetical protein TcCL_Unassigned01086 [Trypanosoma cruzi]